MTFFRRQNLLEQIDCCLEPLFAQGRERTIEDPLIADVRVEADAIRPHGSLKISDSLSSQSSN